MSFVKNSGRDWLEIKKDPARSSSTFRPAAHTVDSLSLRRFWLDISERATVAPFRTPFVLQVKKQQANLPIWKLQPPCDPRWITMAEMAKRMQNLPFVIVTHRLILSHCASARTQRRQPEQMIASGARFSVIVFV